jgi:transaldolase
MFVKDINFSLWLDFIERDYIKHEFRKLIKNGEVNGATSNPAIFKNAILTSTAYKSRLSELGGKSAKEKYETLAKEDIKEAAIALRPLYDNGDDGFVSIEIDPFLSASVEDSVAEGVRLFEEIDEPNVMIKVPATKEGYKIIEELAKREINVNATLIFGLEQTKGVLDAIKRSGAKKAKFVISVFVSRFDRVLNPSLPKELQNRVGVMGAAAHYNLVESYGLPNVKTLFASTGVKGNDLAPHYYVDELIAPNSVNTAPLDTIVAAMANSAKTAKLPIAQSEIDAFFEKLEDENINFEKICDELLMDGLKQFEAAFKEILDELT